MEYLMNHISPALIFMVVILAAIIIAMMVDEAQAKREIYMKSLRQKVDAPADDRSFDGEVSSLSLMQEYAEYVIQRYPAATRIILQEPTSRLSLRLSDMLPYIQQGLTNAEISRLTQIPRSTVSDYRRKYFTPAES